MKLRLQRWFMPWRWSRWAWIAIIVPMVAAMYLLSAVPVDKLTYKMRLSRNTRDLIAEFYVPAFACIERSAVAISIARMECKVMNQLVGPDLRSSPPLYRAMTRREIARLKRSGRLSRPYRFERAVRMRATSPPHIHFRLTPQSNIQHRTSYPAPPTALAEASRTADNPGGPDVAHPIACVD